MGQMGGGESRTTFHVVIISSIRVRTIIIVMIISIVRIIVIVVILLRRIPGALGSRERDMATGEENRF